jgi:hypothetical protein
MEAKTVRKLNIKVALAAKILCGLMTLSKRQDLSN